MLRDVDPSPFRRDEKLNIFVVVELKSICNCNIRFSGHWQNYVVATDLESESKTASRHTPPIENPS